MRNEALYRGTPFKDSMIRKDFNGIDGDAKIALQLHGRNKIVKSIDNDVPGNFIQMEVRKAIKTFTEFGSYSDLHVPNFDVVEGALYPGNKHKKYFFVIDLINGENFPNTEFSVSEKKEGIATTEAFLQSFIQYAQDKHENGGFFPIDQKCSQYVYGRGRGDKKPKIYFVDLDPYIDYYDATNRDNPDNIYFYNSIVALIGEFMQMAESKLGNILGEARKNYAGFLNEMIESKDSYSEVAEDFIARFIDK